MIDQIQALHDVEIALKRWYRATGAAEPDIGILLVGLSEDGIDLQYLGVVQDVSIDWPVVFASIIKDLEAGNYRVDTAAQVKWPSR